MHTFFEAQHAAECAIAAMALRAMFVRAAADESEVVSLRLSVDADGIEVEAVDGKGNAIGGWSL